MSVGDNNKATSRLLPMSDLQLNKLMQQHINEEKSLDSEMKLIKKDFRQLQVMIKERSVQQNKLSNDLKDILLSTQNTGSLLKINEVVIKNRNYDIIATSDKIACTNVDNRILKIRNESEDNKWTRLEKDFEEEEIRVRKRMMNTTPGRDLERARAENREIETRMSASVAFSLSETDLAEEVQQLKLELSCLETELQSCESDLDAKDAAIKICTEELGKLEKEIRILSNRREAHKIRLLKRIKELEAYTSNKDSAHI